MIHEAQPSPKPASEELNGVESFATLPLAQLTEMYRMMYLIRSFEKRVNEYFLKGHIPGTIHLSLGQECVAVGVASALRKHDTLIPTHRGHGHALAKGMDPFRLFAELFARKDGCCGGRGGSLHICDVAAGIMPPNPIVGSSVPYAAGIAFSYQYRKQDHVIASIFGDGAVNTGPLHEGINLAAIWALPIVFVCENNQYAISTHIRNAVLNKRLSERAMAYGIPGVTVDGNDVTAVYGAMVKAVARARAGDGPTFVECLTYRQGGHKRDDPAAYRPKGEVEHWLAQDGLPRLRAHLISDGALTDAEMMAQEAEVDRDLVLAAERALQSPHADPASVMADVYA
ncbi:MAG: thiamine pyrophosphate-dependent dehydrogenase E1 component subunit alpha [Thermoflexales bacterium]